MTVAEAAKVSGYAEWTIQKFAKEGVFPACKPRGNRGGWDIDETAFRIWYRNKRKETRNIRRKLAMGESV